MNLPYVAGRAYFAPGSYSTLLSVANKVYATPIMVSVPGLSFDRIGVNVTTAGAGSGADVRLAIYEDDGKGRPGRLFADYGAKTALTGTGEYSITVNPVDRPMLWPGRVYWLCVAVNTAATTQPTMAALDTSVVPQAIAAAVGVADLGSIPSSAATAAVGLRADMTYGAFPTDGSTLTWTAQLNAKVIMAGLRAA